MTVAVAAAAAVVVVVSAVAVAVVAVLVVVIIGEGVVLHRPLLAQSIRVSFPSPRVANMGTFKPKVNMVSLVRTFQQMKRLRSELTEQSPHLFLQLMLWILVCN